MVACAAIFPFGAVVFWLLRADFGALLRFVGADLFASLSREASRPCVDGLFVCGDLFWIYRLFSGGQPPCRPHGTAIPQHALLFQRLSAGSGAADRYVLFERRCANHLCGILAGTCFLLHGQLAIRNRGGGTRCLVRDFALAAKAGRCRIRGRMGAGSFVGRSFVHRPDHALFRDRPPLFLSAVHGALLRGSGDPYRSPFPSFDSPSAGHGGSERGYGVCVPVGLCLGDRGLQSHGEGRSGAGRGDYGKRIGALWACGHS